MAPGDRPYDKSILDPGRTGRKKNITGLNLPGHSEN